MDISSSYITLKLFEDVIVSQYAGPRKFQQAPTKTCLRYLSQLIESVLGRIRARLFDVLRAWKRRCLESIFSVLGCPGPQSCFYTHSENLRVAKVEKRALAKKKLV